MDPILYVFGVTAATAAAEAARAWWRHRPWTAALLTLVAAVLVTPLTVGLPGPVIVAGLLVLALVVGWLLWPRATNDDPTPDEHGSPSARGAGRDRGGRS